VASVRVQAAEVRAARVSVTIASHLVVVRDIRRFLSEGVVVQGVTPNLQGAFGGV